MTDTVKAKTHLEAVLRKSLQKSAESLGMMIKKEVAFEKFEILDSCQGLDKLDDSQEILVTTEIIGDVNGKSYLMLSEEKGNIIYKNVFGSKNPAISMEVVMKEVDNIVSAAVISVLADNFQVEIFGDVPYFFNTEANKTLELITDDCINYENEEDKFFVKSTLVSNEVNLHMDFYWILSGEIMEKADMAAK